MIKDLISIPVETNHQPNFIGLWSFKNTDICDKIISFFDENEMSHSDIGFYDHADQSVKYDKELVNGKQMQVRLENLTNNDYDPIKNYFLLLEKCFLSYCESWPTIQTDRIGISRNASLVKYLRSEKEFNEIIDRTVIPPHEPNYESNEIATKTWDFDQWYREDNKKK